ncbi:uncharacterized protein LOC142787030 isoform X1 [Rhipicephalus microplus]|uniref:uncharacterized protein LOC142787030 isoform X1 n=1 Tax=Rhipicephalus microplus TaxID=6941 RepID=UPI003F6C0073
MELCLVRASLNSTAECFTGLASLASAAPDCDAKKLDACAADLFIFGSSEKIPTTPEELESFCGTQNKAESCARDYIKHCTESVSQGIGDVFLDDIKSEIEDRCDESSVYREDYLRSAPCLNKVGAGFHKCLRGLVADLDLASKLPNKQRIGGACCKYNVFEQCVSKVVQGQCDSDVIEFAQGLVDRYSGELLGTVCTAYRSGQKCKSIDFSSTSGDKNLRSVLTPILQISGALG